MGGEDGTAGVDEGTESLGLRQTCPHLQRVENRSK